MTGNSTTALPPFLAPTYFFMKFNTAWKFMAIYTQCTKKIKKIVRNNNWLHMISSKYYFSNCTFNKLNMCTNLFKLLNENAKPP